MTLKIYVARDGSAPFTTIRDALDELARIDAETGVKLGVKEPDPAVVYIGPGTYREQVEVRRPRTALVGSESDECRIVMGLGALMGAGDGTRLGTFRTYTMLLDADDLYLRDLTVENDAGDGRDVGQAIALYADCNRLRIENCALLGHQDTLFLGPLPPKELQPGGFIGPKQFNPRHVGVSYFKNCLIAGDVDYVFGGGSTLFEDCELISLSRNTEPNGYVTAASTPQDEEYGFVFHRCRFTSKDCTKKTVYLGRPWRDWAHVALIDCYLGEHIKSEGWDDWGKPSSHGRMKYIASELHGPASNTSAWPTWTQVLSKSESDHYCKSRVLGEWNGTWIAPL